MAIALAAGLSGLNSSPQRGLCILCVVFLDKKLFSHSASLHPGMHMGTGDINAGDNPAMD